MAHKVFSYKHALEISCANCGTPVREGLTTQYVPELDTEICAVCEQPLE